MKNESDCIRVLLVEDNPHVSELFNYAIRRLVSEQNGKAKTVEVMEAGDGHAAWQHLDPATGCGFHLVVLDLNLPVLDGLEVLGRIRSSPETAGTPVLVVTAADQETCDEARARGADEILRKPVQLAQIREALARLL